MQTKEDGVKRRRQRVQGGWALPVQTRVLPESHLNRQTQGQKQENYPANLLPEPHPSSTSCPRKCQLTTGVATQPKGQELSQITMVSEVPRKFSWVEPGLLCGLAFPDRPEHVQYLVEHNVRYLVNLTKDRSPPTHNFPDLKVIRIGIRDFSPPSLDQVQQFLDIVNKAKQKQKVTAVITCNDLVWATLYACLCVDIHHMSVDSAIVHVSSLLNTPDFTERMVTVVEKYKSKSMIPQEFSWVVDGLLCGLALPKKVEHLKYLIDNNVAYLVCLTEEGDPEVIDLTDLVKIELKLPCDSTPDIGQVVEFLTLVDLAQAEKKAVAVNCSDGLRKTGTLLACYLVQKETLTALGAIQKINDLRPGSVRSREQEVLIAEYESFHRKVPRRFSWVVKDRLCAMAFPEHQENMQYLMDQGVGYLVCLTKERDPDVQDFPELCRLDLKMEDFSCPTQAQVREFLSLMDRAAEQHKAVAIHCAGGRGRTGTMISCYWIHSEGLTASQALRRIRDLRPGSVETKEQEQFISDFEKTIRQMPDNFSWVVDDLLCTLAFPESRQNLQYLIDNHVTYLVSLTAERDPPINLCPELEMVSLKIQDFAPPTIQQVVEFLDILEMARRKKQAVALHCSQGQGRTGTMIACYLVQGQRLSAKDAIETTRRLRRGSVETKEQEKLVHDYVKYLHEKRNV